ncbi:MAG TPA: AMP-binding protein [Terriglobia bacterium]|jgi:phenylacetate-CoA ligase|nr:AMP-binding protein [Terriglobia bacterium]
MLRRAQRAFEHLVVGGSIPALVRWAQALPPGLIRRLQEDAFTEVVRYAARHQKFFARKLQTAGIDARQVRRPEDLGDIFTTPDDLLNLPAEDFLCRPPEAVFETTGTSGAPKRVYFAYGELDEAARHEAAAMYKNGVRPGDRVVCTFDGGYWIAGWVTFLGCRQMGVFCSATGKPQPREIYDRMPLYKYNVIAADPTWLVSLSEIAEEEGTFPIKLILAAGDRMTDVYRRYVEDVWKAPVILGYGSTEAAGGVGMECVRQDGYHLDEYDCLFEIVDRDEQGYGELVMTTLTRRTEPLIRYRMRDVTRFAPGPCACGVTLKRIEPIRGRRDEMVVMGAGNMHPGIFERILHDVEGISPNWQVAVRQEGLRDILEFRLELTNGIGQEHVEQSVRHNLEGRYPEVWANHVCGMYNLCFSYQPPGTFGRARKARRLVDERSG